MIGSVRFSILSLFIMVNPCLGDANLKAEQANHRKRFLEISLNGGGGS